MYACLKKISKKINKRVERENHLDNKRQKISSEIAKMQSLTRSEKFKAIRKSRDDTLVIAFWNVEETASEYFIYRILQ